MPKKRIAIEDYGFGRRIDTIIDYFQLNIKDFATKLSYSQSHISDIRTGKKKPTGRLLRAISTVYGVDEEWLRTGEGEMFLSRVTEEGVPYAIDISNRDIKHLLEMIEVIYTHGGDEEKALLMGHVVRIHNRVMGDKEGMLDAKVNERDLAERFRKLRQKIEETTGCKEDDPPGRQNVR